MLIFKGDRVLLYEGGWNFPSMPPVFLRSSKELPASWQELTPWCEVGEDFSTPEGGEWLDLRSLWHREGDKAFLEVGTAWQYMNWWRTIHFCSACGAELLPREEDRGRECPRCQKIFYAPLNPAIIVAVEKEGKLLLAHNRSMPSGRFSVLAGYVEPGETLEEAVVREIREEVSIEVEQVRYFGSQPWPFSLALMLGFTARWKKGQLRPDGVELDEAGWFSPDQMPDIPSRISISRKLIDHFCQTADRFAAGEKGD